MEITEEFTVTEEDIDLFNHMNYKRYIDFFEQERAHWFTAIGLPFEKMTEQEIAVVILKLDTDYKKEVRFGEHVTVHTSLGKLGTKSFTMKQTMYNADQIEVAQSLCTFVMFNLKERKSIRVVDEIARCFPVKQTR